MYKYAIYTWKNNVHTNEAILYLHIERKKYLKKYIIIWYWY